MNFVHLTYKFYTFGSKLFYMENTEKTVDSTKERLHRLANSIEQGNYSKEVVSEIRDIADNFKEDYFDKPVMEIAGSASFPDTGKKEELPAGQGPQGGANKAPGEKKENLEHKTLAGLGSTLGELGAVPLPKINDPENGSKTDADLNSYKA